MIDNKKKSDIDEWKAGFEGLSFEESAIRFRDKIIESPELDKKSIKFFLDAFDYVMGVYKSGKPLDVNQMRIHMVDLKGHNELTLTEFNRTLLLLSLCGFGFNFADSQKNKTK